MTLASEMASRLARTDSNAARLSMGIIGPKGRPDADIRDQEE